MQIPPLPGVYVVELLNDHPISVNADRLSIADRSIMVTRANCKYGRAVNLSRRERDYRKTFGVENVRFRFYAVTERAAEIEALISTRLAAHRVRGSNGRPNEWLQGISAQDVEKVVREALAFIPEAPSGIAAPTRLHTESALLLSPADVVEAAQYLRDQGMSVTLLRDLHHFQRRTETFSATIRYFGLKKAIQTKNQLYGARLLHVARNHRGEGCSFEEMVREALRLYPK